MTHVGHGIGLRPAHFTSLLEHGARGVDWFEAISDDYFTAGGRHWAVLKRVRCDVPVVLHGVGLGIGNAAGPDDDYLRRLKGVIERIEPAWVSDHLCWTGVDGTRLHDLLPLPYDEATLARVCDAVDRVQATLRRRILLENVTRYFDYRASTIPEGEFLAAIAARTGCGILLDVNNLVVVAKNLGHDPLAVVRALAPGSVGQIHLAGHTTYADGSVIDTHVGPVPREVWALYRAAIDRLGPIPTLVEWDDDVPPLPVVAAQADVAREIEASAVASSEPKARAVMTETSWSPCSPSTISTPCSA